MWGFSMKLSLLCSVAFLAASSPVLAADLVQPVAGMPFSWTGFYVGGQAGGGWNDSHWSGSFFPFDTNGSGGIFGGQIGYNWQIDQYVIGIEGDLAGSTVKGDNQCSVATGTTCETKQDYLASVRGRLGYAVDRFLIYGDAGVAFTKYKIAEVDSTTPQTFGGGSRVGWTAGLGAEYALTDHWTAGAEWNYYDFGTRTGFDAGGQLLRNRDTENTVVGKINYKF
ncbi:Outer membrane protein [Mesorhizobium plurifarium]|uniref:Outer membrane protein n=1 Tax=Mesorhizobium plurifarium TaxID=69974 RepID=A0A0K2W1B3_MESPL|nr:Outer membrane protein [Mesorhizobium plurifarium]